MAKHAALIAHKNDLDQFAPPDHKGTVNIRLSDKSFCDAFETVLGTVTPGGEAEPHRHENEHQIIYILQGSADVGLGDDPMTTCGPGDVIRIPPKLEHAVVAKGDEDFQCVIIYSPPLPKRNDEPVAEKRVL
jgi:quercetin dioxygenase-like cupin family protein